MKTFLAVDHSSCSDRVLAAFVESYPYSHAKIRLCMIINPFVPPPMTSFIDGLEYFQYALRYQAYSRLEQLANILRLRDLDVEVDLVETRIPESLAIMIRAFQYDADTLMVGIHSLLGIKRFVMQRVFGFVSGGGAKKRSNEHSE